MPQVNPSTSAPKIVSNPLRLSWRNVILGLFIGTTLIGGGLVAFYYFELKNSTSSTQNQRILIGKPKSSSPSATPAQPRIITDETADWKTLISQTVDKKKTIKFSFKYPSSFRIVEIKNTVPVVTNDPDYEIEPPSLKNLGKIVAFVRIASEVGAPSGDPNTSLGGKKAFLLS